jgi:hypothetical protein
MAGLLERERTCIQRKDKNCFAGTLFPVLLSLRVFTQQRFASVQSSNLAWPSDSEDCPKRGLTAGTLQLTGWVPKMLGCTNREMLFQLN